MLKKCLILFTFSLFAFNPLHAAIKKKSLNSRIFYSILHPFHISITEIKYNASQKSLEIAQKIFWDDLEVELNDYSKSKINFLKPRNKEELNKLVQKYMLEHSEILINGKKTSMNYLGYEIEEDVAWVYMEAENIPVPQTAEIKNSVLFKNFPGQQNIINFYKDKLPKSLRLIENQIQGKITF
jgi:hypothetical protein